MKRIVLVSLLVTALAGGVAVAASDDGGGGDDGPKAGRYVIELDNAFGLVKGGDVKIGGVRAGIIRKVDLSLRTRRALLTIDLERPGFDSLRADARCETRPQSLIGEYSLNCEPGRSERELPGRRLPVTRTSSAIALDLINNVMRRPVRERLRLLLGELGAGVAGRAPELNAAIRRAVPALTQTNRVLRVLAEENRTLERLVRDADTVVDPLARRRREVSRFVREAGDLSAASADRRDALAAQWRRLPGFLNEVPGAMRDLGRAADAQAGALAEASSGADELTAFFGALKPFSRTSRPALKALGRSAKTGTPIVADALPVSRQLGAVSERLPELSQNLAIVLEHLDDREHAVEPDARSPGGRGYTGIEAFLQYIFNQANAINIFDANNHILKANLQEREACAPWADGERAREHKECNSWLGPYLPGIFDPDPTAEPDKQTRRAKTRRARTRRRAPRREERAAAAPQPSAGREDRRDTPQRRPDDVLKLPQLPDVRLPELPATPPVQAPKTPATDDSLLDYLLG